VEHVDQVVISGLPGDAIPGELGHALDPEHPEKVPPQSGTVSFKVGSKPSYTLEISAARSRPRIWIWPLNLPKKEAPPINRTLDVPVSQKPVEVPDLTGMTFVEAGKAASSFTVQPGQPVKEATAKEGTVVSQEPKADTLKAPGETIVVHLAEGSTVPPPQPDVALKEPVGQPAAVVRAALQSKGIVPTEETRSGAGLPGTVLESIPADLTTVQPGGAAKLVISEKKVLEQTGGVWQVGGGTAGQYAQWAAEALNTQPATGGPPAQCALVVVGPDMPPPGLTVPAGAAVLGIGPGGRAFLSRIDAEHFKAMKDATGSNAADVNIHDLKDRLFGGKTPPLRYQQQAFSASAPAHIAAHPIPMFPIDGTRLDGGAPLTQLYRENRALVGWSTNRGYWGFRDVGTFSPGMKETFQALVRQITTP
ncbi:MAG: hypothetical protein K0Q72_3110, partial [Armatimonadetes bacterium]|jgi:hypothetical protein|nr:hypothetical protein [Armatimonadota bacterium]